MVKVTVVRGMKIWSVEGKVTIAKCVKTGRFVKRAVAQKALETSWGKPSLVDYLTIAACGGFFVSLFGGLLDSGIVV